MLSADCCPRGSGEEGFHWLKLIGRISRLKADQIPLQMQAGAGSMNPATNGLLCQGFPELGCEQPRPCHCPPGHSLASVEAARAALWLVLWSPASPACRIWGTEGCEGLVVVPAPVPCCPCSTVPPALCFDGVSCKR